MNIHTLELSHHPPSRQIPNFDRTIIARADEAATQRVKGERSNEGFVAC